MKFKKKIETILHSSDSVQNKLQKVCNLLYDEVPYYNWVGFYFKNGEKNELKLGPYAGAETEHTIIPFGKGICGQVAESNEKLVVPDVTAEDNYLACSLETKAEVVIPIFKNDENIGQLDIDSHFPNPFTGEDIEELEWICQEVSEIL